MNIIKLTAILLATVGSISSVHAISVTATDDAATLAAALLGSGITPTSTIISGQSLGGALSTGTYTNASGTYGIGDGVVISSGDVADYSDGPNTLPDKSTDYDTNATPAQEALLDPISGGVFPHFDATQIDIIFDVDLGTDTIFFDVVFGSEEYPEFVGSSFLDAFGIYLNSVNIALSGALPINIDHPKMAAIPGTELDGVLDPDAAEAGAIMHFSDSVVAGSTGNTLTFILADTSDNDFDSTVYISGFGNVTPPNQVPEPGVLLLTGIGIFVLRRHQKILQPC